MQETNFVQWIVLAMVQGITEYLPVSSSAHLILVSKVMHWKDQGLVMDITAHAGSLIAVLWYFKIEIIKLFQGKNWPLFFKLSLASVPLAICGYLFADVIETQLRKPLIIASSSVFFGVLLYLSDKFTVTKSEQKSQKEPSYKHTVLIGLAQVFALIPGASRSGVTMTAAMAQGFNRTQAARISFLLAIPALLMTTAYGLLKLYSEPTHYNGIGLTVVFWVSFIASLLSIKLFLKIIERINIITFVWYRLLLAVLIVWLIQ